MQLLTDMPGNAAEGGTNHRPLHPHGRFRRNSQVLLSCVRMDSNKKIQSVKSMSITVSFFIGNGSYTKKMIFFPSNVMSDYKRQNEHHILNGLKNTTKKYWSFFPIGFFWTFTYLKGKETKREAEMSHLLVHFLFCHNGYTWASLKPRVRSCFFTTVSRESWLLTILLLFYPSSLAWKPPF